MRAESLEERLTEPGDIDMPRVLRGFTTRAVHAGERPELPAFTPTVTPIYPSVSYLADDPETQDAVFGGEQQGYVYTRHGNPTTRALEVAVAALEETEDAVAFGSGMAALLAAILNEVQAGDRVVASRDLYGATQALLGNVFGTLGVRTTYVDIRDLDAVERVLAEVRPRVLLFETISNPLVRVADIPALVEIAGRSRVKSIVDNTFATPLLENAASLARWLARHPRITRVYYPAIDPLGDAERVFNGDLRGGIVAFDIANAGRDEVFRFLRALRICLPVTTLGDVYTVVLYPPLSTHRTLSAEERAAACIGDGLVRLSAGIEDVADLIEDLDRALAVVG